jgi:hypothetical protein
MNAEVVLLAGRARLFAVAAGLLVATSPVMAASPSAPSGSAPADEAAWRNAIDLLPLIDPQKDAVKGEWTFQKGGLIGDLDKYGRIEIPYQPPEEYDFRVEFSRGRREIAGAGLQFLAKAGREFAWVFFSASKTSKNLFGFSGFNGTSVPEKTEFFPDHESGRHISLVEVRNDSLRAYFNGKLVVECKPNYADADLRSDRRLHSRGVLGLGCQSRTTFHRVEVREVTGKGKFTRNLNAATPEQELFNKEVAALSPEQQVARVIGKLKDLNPAFDGKETHKVEAGAVTELSFSTVGVTDLGPLKALTGLKKLAIVPAPPNQKGTLSSLAPLKGLPLTMLWCHNNPIADIGPLRGMPLTVLSVGGTLVDDLTPLTKLKLSVLSFNDTPVADLTPLQDTLLAVLWCHNTKVTDFAPLGKVPLQELKCDFVAARDTDTLKRIKTLMKINDVPAATFWMRAGFALQSTTPAKTVTPPPPAQATKFNTPLLPPKPLAGTRALAEQTQARDEIRRLCAKVKGFAAVDLPSSGKVVLSPKNSLTIDMLRNVAIDDTPPVLKPPNPPYTSKECDGCEPGQAPYAAPGIQPFRFRFFNNEFCAGLGETKTIRDYASAHGFNIIMGPRSLPWKQHLPTDTKIVNLVHVELWEGKLFWNESNIPEGRYDRVADVDVTTRSLLKLTQAGYDINKSPRIDPVSGRPLYPLCDRFTLDIEPPRPLSPEGLRKQAWYPQKASANEQAAFEKKYYDGYAAVFIGPLRAMRKLGYTDLSMYGWAPFEKEYIHLATATSDPQKYWEWNRYGKQIYAEVDVLHPSLYSPFQSSQSLAYTLGNIDNNCEILRQERNAKPIRPYYWNLYHGGGGKDWRWWRGQPLTMEESRAISAMGFFTGFDGMVMYGGAKDLIVQATPNSDVTVGRQFDCQAETGSVSTTFLRYDVIHITDVDGNGNVRFQKINRKTSMGSDYGTGPDKPFYVMPKEKLLPNLRTWIEPIAAFIEGLALVKPFEYLLRRGEVKIDVPAEVQFAKKLPVVRRMKLGQWHVLATYDPNWEADPEPKEIELKNFDGHPGLTVVLPADSQTRIFLLKYLF